jgi:hypothetical protein
MLSAIANAMSLGPEPLPPGVQMFTASLVKDCFMAGEYVQVGHSYTKVVCVFVCFYGKNFRGCGLQGALTLTITQPFLLRGVRILLHGRGHARWEEGGKSLLSILPLRTCLDVEFCLQAMIARPSTTPRAITYQKNTM